MLVRPDMKRLFCLKAKNELGRFAPSALPHYYASTCTLCVDALQARPTKCCGRRSRYGKTCAFYMYSSRISSCVDTYLWYSNY